MRIISGSFRGKKIIAPKDIKTRPLKDLTKESIFNIINHSKKFTVNLNDSFVLDIFSGVGSFGIECLSRGVKKVVFIENYKEVLSILKKNLINLKSVKNYEIIEKDALKMNTLSMLDKKFDIIFLDPPYKFENLKTLLSNIQNAKVLKNNGIIIIHRHKNSKDFLQSKIKIFEEKSYGISKIIFATFLN